MLVNIAKLVFVALLWRQTADSSPKHCHDGKPDESELVSRRDGEPVHATNLPATMATNKNAYTVTTNLQAVEVAENTSSHTRCDLQLSPIRSFLLWRQTADS